MVEHGDGDAARVDAVWGDPANRDRGGRHWESIPAVQRSINRRVTGDPATPPLAWLFVRLMQPHRLPIDRALVLGCGGGKLERQLIGAGWVREVVAIDLSASVLRHAAAAAEREGMRGIRYLQADMNRLALDEAPFDAVLGVAAVHHCTNLESLFDEVDRLLLPGGCLFLDEYVGPDRFQWTDRQLRHANQLLGLLPDDLLRTAAGEIRRGFDRLSPEAVVAHDPSEATRASQICGAVAERFDVVERRGYGGALLHLVLAHVAQNFTDGPAFSRAAVYLDRLIATEDRLCRLGHLTDDFAVIVARRRARDIRAIAADARDGPGAA